ncbi:MAG TPA: hypothetical protein VER96_12290 [Polyangiaceae bacterium]|nr:hypothetical protein [Polyangiaceae bacterium]
MSDTGVRRCNQDDQCNQDTDCAPGNRCALPDGSFLGRCTAGKNKDLCQRTADCDSGLFCFTSFDGSQSGTTRYGQCSDGRSGSSCSEDSNCRTGGCVARTCTDGTVGEFCSKPGDCQASLQCVPFPVGAVENYPGLGQCSDGTKFSQCQVDRECAPGNYCANQTFCMDGSEDSLCDRDEQCHSGRCALAGSENVCTSGSQGATCFDAGDCLGGSCERAPGTADWQFGKCG